MLRAKSKTEILTLKKSPVFLAILAGRALLFGGIAFYFFPLHGFVPGTGVATALLWLLFFVPLTGLSFRAASFFFQIALTDGPVMIVTENAVSLPFSRDVFPYEKIVGVRVPYQRPYQLTAYIEIRVEEDQPIRFSMLPLHWRPFESGRVRLPQTFSYRGTGLVNINDLAQEIERRRRDAKNRTYAPPVDDA